MTRPGQGYVPVDSIYPHKGFNSLDPATIIDPAFSPKMENMVVTDGIPGTRTGYLQLGDNLGGHPVQELIEWSTESGARQLIAITTLMQYRFDSSTRTWTNITQDGAEEDACSTFIGPDTIKLTGDQTGTYSEGDYIRITGTVNSGVYLIDSLEFDATTDITVDITYKTITTTAAATDEVCSLVVPQTGDIDKPIDYCVATDDSDTYLFITNAGVDKVLWTNGSGNFALYKPVDIAAGAGFKAYTVALRNNHLMFGNTDTDGEKYFIWSNNGDFSEATGFAAGVNDTSGSVLLPDSQGAILKLKNLGDRMIVYSENSIGVINYIGGDFIFSYEQVLRNTRLLSARSIVDLGPFHLYVSQENIYMFDGTRLLRAVGDLIQEDYRKNVDLNLADQAFAFHDTPLNEVYFVIPTSTSGEGSNRVYLLEYDLFRPDNNRWSIQTFSDRILSMGYFTLGDTESGGTGLTWGSGSIAALTWDTFDQTAPWNSGTIREGFPVRILGSNVGDVFESGTTQQDDDSSFTSIWESIDFTVPQVYASEYGRWIDLDIELRGSSVDIAVSTIGGNTIEESDWTTVVTGQSLNSRWTRYKFPIDVFGETCRVRVKTYGGGFQLKWLRLWVRPGGAR